ncbi:YadA-like family protein, partial [Snodgrassella sp. B3088]|uniref:YadA family autotransporter adhesin n=1 Tax=Snodgrassella sp. B3088 TaxID=2818038 RepID=UPI002269CC68
LTSLSSSTSSGLTSLTSSLSSTNQNLTTLQQNALQWNSSLTAYDASHGGGTAQRITNVAAGRVALDSTDAINGSQLFSLSGSTSTGLSSLSTNLNEVTKNQLGSLSTIVTDSLSTVIKSVSSLSTGLSDTNTNVGNLQKDALQWNNAVNAYDATRGGRAQNLTGIADGNISAGSSDAINGAQMYSLSTLTQAGLNSSSTGLSSLSSATSAGLTTVNDRVDTLTSTTQLGLASASTGLTSLSSSTSTGLTSLTSSLSSTNQNLTTLQQNALQWNSTLGAYDASHGSGTAQRITNVAAGRVAADSTDAVNGSQLYALSGSTSTGLNSLSTVVSSTVISGINSISNSMSTGYESLSRSLSTASDSLDKLATNTSTSLSSLSTSFGNTQKDVKELKDKSLQWSDDKNGFDAGRPNKLTRDFDGKYGKIINVADGLVDQDSHDAVNGGQLYTERSRLTSLSTSTSTGLSTITSILQDTPTGEMITNITNLTKNALQWNGTLGAYDASHGSGTAQRITNVAAGNLARGSLDAVNAGQLWDVKTDLDNLSTLVHSLPTGTVSDAQLNSLSTAISQVVGSQIASIASGLGTSYTPGSNAINPPKYDTSTPTGGNVTANNVADALQNIQNYGTKYAKINSAKAASIAQGADSIAVGGAAMASGSSAIAIGDSASAPAANGVALGSNAQVKQSGGVALGSGSVASTAAGKVGYIPVTATSQQAAAIRATRSTEGAVSVGDASKGVYRQITGVAAGTADTDAVNVAQLKGVNNQITNINKYVNQVNERVQRTERRAYSGTALAMALSGAYLPSLNAGEQAVGVGVGTYRGYTAVGANYKAMSNSGNIGWGAGVSTTGKEVGFNAGVGFKWSNN